MGLNTSGFSELKKEYMALGGAIKDSGFLGRAIEQQAEGNTVKAMTWLLWAAHTAGIRLTKEEAEEEFDSNA